MIEVRPDPAHPLGGFALLEVPADALAGPGAGLGAELGAEASVEVFDSFASRYLGDGGWQAPRFAFGPYPVERAGGVARVRIGPEIVNRMTEYQAVRLGLGSLSAELAWPDDVLPAAEAAVSGGILATAAPERKPAETPVVHLKDTAPKPPEGTRDVSDATAGKIDSGGTPGGTTTGTTDPVPGPSRKPLLLAGLALLLLLAGAAYYLTRPPAPGPDPVPPAPAPVPAPAPEPAPEPAPAPACAMADLSALAGQGFAAVAERLRACGPAVSADDAFGVIETVAKAGDPAALTLFGQFYDGEAADPDLETGLGLGFPDNPAQAADYYDRAKAAGSAEAGPLLEAVCRRLLLKSDTLSQGAHEDHCGS